ncbi:diguanylate cyclase [Paraconexibacter antarcticus]|uniref:Diguanylate cyclase n=1 Tax=Paraconexibacter antarcticus TaxID=2949664 RepID=A0ABY5DUP8_9ACTN|nr:diguanylate cyclase [Paraconexibacter antarcticus]UTI64756.1 diguanylate cyclase [Paraconexibacter antarcticus]
MSFRNRLTLFFVLIVIVPMLSLTVVLFTLIADNETGKQDAGVAARQTAAIHLYDEARDAAGKALVHVGRDLKLATALRAGDQVAASRRATVLLDELSIKRIVIVRGTSPFVDVGSTTAVFPATRPLTDTDGAPIGTLQVSTSGPKSYATLVKRVTGLNVLIVRGGTILADTLGVGGRAPALPAKPATVEVAGGKYRTAAFRVPGFQGAQIRVAVLGSTAKVRSNVRQSRLFAGALLFGFFTLAFLFALLVSRSLQRQIGGFLEAARRIGSGDFGARVPTVGSDEFAELGDEFNRMSGELEKKIAEVEAEQARLALAMRRIGETFASNLDRDALLEIVLRTAVDGSGAAGGRATIRSRPEAQLHQVAQAGSLDDLTAALRQAEAAVLESGASREVTVGGVTALAHPLRAVQQSEEDGPPRITGIVSVARPGTPFRPSERELFHYLAGQASVSIENVGLHERVERQAVTDELTGLANRRRFQQVLSGEVERSRRFGQPVGLVMLDIDNFKKVNDTYGHPAGDLVLREVARVVREASREIDEPARYGGEEMAVILPGTDVEGAFQLAERIREDIAELRLPIRTAEDEPLRVTASFGVATHPHSAADPRSLIAGADAALYEAKHSGKNRTVRAAEVAQS